ncbi:hypothetical protein WJ96_06340 [Burkholderia ubonensis]|uniref:Lipoprotein n=1 Tax=Burkholderia ubonensis TaxID=101571 RepID=A0AAW3MW76_9BURK|nr:hypothetical protein [Burkholderia ubonensis]KVP98188.1 hypothetical protein WJ96_06340 [Burkholderia ubonensis]KVZ92886.1 hypothetical protein WL25_18005 [Burkholderia ubonensis]
MKKLIALAVLGAAPLIGSAATGAGCDAACERNVAAVFQGPTKYTMRVADAAHAHISIIWRAKRNAKLKPVSFEGTAPVRLRHTSLHGVEFDTNDVCKAVVTLLELHGDDDFDVYQVPVRNTQCNS